VAILVRSDGEAWRAYLPDFNGCRAEGKFPSNFEISRPWSLTEIRDDPPWAGDINIDGQNTIAMMMEL
jgi:hypothetical protein